MRIELGDIVQALVSGCINYGNAALLISAIGDIDSFLFRIVTDVVRIFSNLHSVQQLERITIVNSELSVCAVRHEKPVNFPDVNDSLWRRCTYDAVYIAA